MQRLRRIQGFRKVVNCGVQYGWMLAIPVLLAACKEHGLFAPDKNPGLPPYVSVSPENTGDGWTTSTPEDEGMDEELLLAGLEDIRDDGRSPGIDSVIIVRNGHLVAEAYYNGYGPDTLHDVRSASKSITSALAGIAIEQGALSTEDTLAELVDNIDDYKNPDPRKAAIKIIDLLNMSSGLDCNDWRSDSPGNEEKMYRKRDWIAFILDLPMIAEPGEYSFYCSGGVILLGHIISLRTGMALDDFADTYLFGPLNIHNLEWRRSPDGQATGGGGMRLRPRDAAKFGQLYLNQGLWQDEVVISSAWVDESQQHYTSLQQNGYGLLWWKREFQVRNEIQDAFFASGNGGNFIFLFPEENLAVVFTGSNYNSPLGDQPYSFLSNAILPTLK